MKDERKWLGQGTANDTPLEGTRVQCGFNNFLYHDMILEDVEQVEGISSRTTIAALV